MVKPGTVPRYRTVPTCVLVPYLWNTVAKNVLHLTWKLPGVPGEVLLAVGVLDVQPHHVHRDVVLVELRVHLHTRTIF